jgi:uncharacterized membrane protein YphA (DoxX/SURF4 family)
MQQAKVNLLNKTTFYKAAMEIGKYFAGLFGAATACDRSKINRRVDVLRWARGFIYLWFGALKFFPGLSSAEQIAGTTIELMSSGLLTPDLSLPLLALWETAVGLALLTGKFQRIAVFTLYIHAVGTFAPLILLPGQTWNLPPFAASFEGQYILKNLVTIGAAHRAAAVALPGRSGKVGADFSVIAGIGVQIRFRCDKIPVRAVPSVDLHADRIRVKGNFISRLDLQAVAIGRQVRRFDVAVAPSR